MTERDLKVIDLLNRVDVATREQIQRVVYPNTHINVPIRRLKFMNDNKYIKRSYYNLGGRTNAYVYYLNKKPSKRNIKHNLLITEFIIRVIEVSQVLEIKTNFKIGNIIADSYIRYKDTEGKIRHIFLEVQLSNKVIDCTNKYKNIKNDILEEQPNWGTIPRLIVITDLKHEETKIKGVTIKYDTLEIKNIRELLF